MLRILGKTKRNSQGKYKDKPREHSLTLFSGILETSKIYYLFAALRYTVSLDVCYTGSRNELSANIDNSYHIYCGRVVLYDLAVEGHDPWRGQPQLSQRGGVFLQVHSALTQCF